MYLHMNHVKTVFNKKLLRICCFFVLYHSELSQLCYEPQGRGPEVRHTSRHVTGEKATGKIGNWLFGKIEIQRDYKKLDY